MSETQRICVLQYPSPTETAWTTAIRSRAEGLGWRVHDLGVATDWPTTNDRSAVFFTTGIHGAETLNPTHWIVLTENTAVSAGLVSGVLGVSHYSHASLVHTSIRLALSAKFADENADVQVLDAGSLSLDIAGLGRIERLPVDDICIASPSHKPLQIFDQLPIPIGASAEWQPAIFNYPKGQAMDGGSPDIDLTGRARVLVFGPFVYLPEGSWTVDINVTIDPLGGKVRLRFDWGDEADFVSHEVFVTKPGRYSITLARTWVSVTPAQVRIWLMQPLFQGRLVFEGCNAYRSPDDTPQTTST